MYGYFEPPPPPRPDPNRGGAGQSRHDQRLRQDTQQAWNLHLESTGSNVPARFLTESPLAVTLVTEDLCWQAATEDWKHRRPFWWRSRARRAWKAEGAELAAQAERLRELSEYVFQEL